MTNSFLFPSCPLRPPPTRISTHWLFFYRLQLVHFLIVFPLFNLSPPPPYLVRGGILAAAEVVAVIRLRWQREREGEGERECQAYHTADWSGVTSSTESLTFHGRCKSIHLCQARAAILAFPELAYWSPGRNAWVRTSCFSASEKWPSPICSRTTLSQSSAVGLNLTPPFLLRTSREAFGGLCHSTQITEGFSSRRKSSIKCTLSHQSLRDTFFF